MKSTHAFSLFVIFLMAMTSYVWAQDTKREIVTSQNSDYFGFDLRSVENVSLDQCKQVCLDDNACRAFTYNTKVNWCFLKSDFNQLIAFEGAVAGKVVEVSSEADLGAPPQLKFLTDVERNQAVKFRSDIANIAIGAATGPVSVLIDNARIALRERKFPVAQQWYQLALKRTQGNPAQWTAISREVSGWLRTNRLYNRSLQTLSFSASLNAYQWSRTETPRATALTAVAEALEQRRQYRQAIAAYRASLAVKEVADTRLAFGQLRREKGFRVTGHAVEADSATPRVCVDFNEELAKSGTNYEDYVATEGTNASALTVSNARLCVEGLRHGSQYRVVLRQGLPAQSGEVLLDPVILNVYVRDRAPTVRFTGDNFVLASAARRGIPIVGINAEKAELELLRVGERSLSRIVSGSNFLKQLEQYSASNINWDLGESIWKGTIDLATERNRETTTSFPIDEALPERQPGIYILTAKAAGEKRNSWDPMATQWFLISDIGLVTYAGNDGLTVFASSLNTGKPLANVNLDLLARNNQILGSVTTDDSGRARLDPGLMRGSAGLAPTVLTAKHKDGGATDFVFLDITRAGFDLSDRGVEGRASPGPLDVFTYLDRGIYRPGETINVVSLVRDQMIDAVTNLPMTTILSRPDNVEAKRFVTTNSALGGHDAAFELPENAMRGVWHLRVYSDPKAAPLTETKVLVEDFVPDRIEFDLTSSSKALVTAEPASIQVKGKYLYGAPAADLGLEGSIRLKPVRNRDAAKGFQFGLDGEEAPGGTFLNLERLPKTNPEGVAVFDALLEQLPKTTLPLVADVQVRMRESGGRAVERNLSLPVQAQGPMIGLRAQFDDGQVAEGATAGFDLIALDQNDQRISMSGLTWSLYRIERNYQWYRSSGNWRYEAVEIPRLVENGQVDLQASETAELSFPVEWGRYKLQVESTRASGPASSILFNAGWYVETSSTDTPDALEIALDKENYKAGETAKLNVSARHEGELLVAIGADRIQDAFRVAVKPGDNEIDIDVKSDWGAGAYVTATLFKPGNLVETRLPARSIGTKWLAVDPGERSLAVSLDLPEKIRPNALLDIPVSVTNAAAGEEIFITVAAVDVGILNLTRHQPPNPTEWYFGQRKLGLEIRDLYGRLIDGSLGSFGRIRSGGDGPGLTAEGSPPTEELLSLFSGVVQLDASGKTDVSFYIPQFSGTARVMAVAWSAKAVGQASGDVIIRDPVLLSASLPKVLAPSDKVQTVLEIHNTDGATGTYELSVTTDDLIKLDPYPEALELAAGERHVIALSMEAVKPGQARFDLEISQDGESLSQVSRSLKIRPATTPVATKSEFLLAANSGSVTIDQTLLSDSYQAGAEVGIHVGYNKSLDVSSLLMRLDRYPYGCAEQTVSRAMPLLYLSEFDTPDALSPSVDLNERIDGAIRRVSNFQSASGGFGLWGPGSSGGLWLDAYISDFLTRAREKGYSVSEQTMRLAIQNLQNRLAYQNQIQGTGDDFAYALYVLARNRLASASDLRYYADTQLDSFKTPLARAHLASALSLYNEQQRTNRTFSSAVEMANKSLAVNYTNDYYGSLLRDGAAMLALAAETPSAANLVPELLKFVDSEVVHRRYTSTQEDAWMVLAARAVEEANRSLRLSVNDTETVGALKRKLSGVELAATPISVVNNMSQPVTAVVTKYAAPLTPLPATSKGYEIVRKYYRLDGTETSLNDVAQNERFVVVLTVSEFNNAASQVMVSDLLPGGFEIDNPRLVQSAELENFDWIGEVRPAHTEFRDDRFLAAFQRNVGDPRTFNLAYVVRAVTPGQFTHPAASVEDMYRPQYSARTASGFLQVKAAR